MRTRYCSGNSKIDNEYHFTQTISGSRGPDFAVADARRSRTRRRDVPSVTKSVPLSYSLQGDTLGDRRNVPDFGLFLDLAQIKCTVLNQLQNCVYQVVFYSFTFIFNARILYINSVLSHIKGCIIYYGFDTLTI